ncbi:fumarate hydratase [Klebsiella variicola subsp. variicola]|nr:fumarate hydratase [Klebsiella variicola subsp. variicola]
MALQFLRNSEIAAKGILPTCQDTGTAIIMGKKRPARLDRRWR